ncbi:Helicase-associated domain containing protein [Aphelenchoides avenae]|nr:Helicase-associated domain containing protein [Aphelenchus avenae]
MDRLVSGIAGLRVRNRREMATDRITRQRRALPIYSAKDDLMATVSANQVVIVVGETGSGKTTQIPQYLMEAGYGRIAVTQPRKIAAMSVARRVSAEQRCQLGTTVGYTVRFDDKSSEETKIRYMTDGILLGELLRDNDLDKYSCVMLDEAHERHIDTDILFGLLSDLLLRRADLKLIVSRQAPVVLATLDVNKFARYFQAPILEVSGRMFPVQVFYERSLFFSANMTNYVPKVAAKIEGIHRREEPGDILVFLTGQEDVDYCCNEIEQLAKTKRLLLKVLPLYGALPAESQQEVFSPVPSGYRKVVVATNIAETSVTIDGISYVVDLGYVKQTSYNQTTRMDTLTEKPISRAAAEQRRGRAGRTGPGKCFRLYTEETFTKMDSVTVPEIQRTNLISVALQLKTYGINDLTRFRFMDPPPHRALVDAITDLYILGALDQNGCVTSLGKKMSRFPLDPPLAKLLIASAEHRCSDEILTIVSILSAQYNNVFFRPRKRREEADLRKAQFDSGAGDLLALLEVYKQWKDHDYSRDWCQANYVQHKTMDSARQVRQQLHDMMVQRKLRVISCNDDLRKVQRAICAGMFFNAAVKSSMGQGYTLITKGQSAVLHPSSNLFNDTPEWVIYSELIQTKQKFIRNVTLVKPRWLTDHFIRLYAQSSGDGLAGSSSNAARASHAAAVQPDAQIIDELVMRLRRTLTQYKDSFGIQFS